MQQSIGPITAFSKPGDSQPKSTTRNDPQRGQRDMGGMVDMKEPALIDMALVRMCRDELDAVNLCIDLSRLPDEVLSSNLGIDKGHWSRMRKGRAHFPTRKRLALMYLAGNLVPLQYEMDKSGIYDRLRVKFSQDDGFTQWARTA